MLKDEDYVVIGLSRYNDMRDELNNALNDMDDLEGELEQKNQTIQNLTDQILYLQEQIKGEIDDEPSEDEDI